MIEKPTLVGEYVTLRPISAEHAPAMFASLDDPESTRLTGTQDTFTFEQVERHCMRVASAEDRLDYAITRTGDPTYLGEIVLNDIDDRNHSAGFRIALARQELFGQGLGSAAMRLLFDHAFEALKLHRIELEVYDFNPRAIYVYEKMGFVREGVRRDALLWDGAYRDAIVMGLLAEEYTAVRSAIS